jgi:hypothetical protein
MYLYIIDNNTLFQGTLKPYYDIIKNFKLTSFGFAGKLRPKLTP